MWGMFLNELGEKLGSKRLCWRHAEFLLSWGCVKCKPHCFVDFCSHALIWDSAILVWSVIYPYLVKRVELGRISWSDWEPTDKPWLQFEEPRHKAYRVTFFRPDNHLHYWVPWILGSLFSDVKPMKLKAEFQSQLFLWQYLWFKHVNHLLCQSHVRFGQINFIFVLDCQQLVRWRNFAGGTRTLKCSASPCTKT